MSLKLIRFIDDGESIAFIDLADIQISKFRKTLTLIPTDSGSASLTFEIENLIFVKEKKCLFAFSTENKESQFGIIFDNDEMCQSYFDDTQRLCARKSFSEKEVIDLFENNFLIPFSKKIKQNPNAFDDGIKNFISDLWGLETTKNIRNECDDDPAAPTNNNVEERESCPTKQEKVSPIPDIDFDEIKDNRFLFTPSPISFLETENEDDNEMKQHESPPSSENMENEEKVSSFFEGSVTHSSQINSIGTSSRRPYILRTTKGSSRSRSRTNVNSHDTIESNLDLSFSRFGGSQQRTRRRGSNVVVKRPNFALLKRSYNGKPIKRLLINDPNGAGTYEYGVCSKKLKTFYCIRCRRKEKNQIIFAKVRQEAGEPYAILGSRPHICTPRKNATWLDA